MQTIQQIPSWFSKQKLSGKVAIGCAGLFMLCCLCSIPMAILSPSTPTSVTQNTSVAQVESSPIAVQTESVAEVAPTATPEPTNTPLPPTPTQNLNLIKPGTYLVGVDIKPGIYRGEAGDGLLSSCYWGRLKDLSGSLEALLANENAIGQFYVQVVESDFALKTACELVPLDSLPSSTGEFPQKIQAGTYIVGRDIQAGTYKGEAGTDIMKSCYWGRLKDLSGSLEALLANENAIGQFYVQVAGSDFALKTACELERVGD